MIYIISCDLSDIKIAFSRSIMKHLYCEQFSSTTPFSLSFALGNNKYLNSVKNESFISSALFDNASVRLNPRPSKSGLY